MTVPWPSWGNEDFWRSWSEQVAWTLRDLGVFPHCPGPMPWTPVILDGWPGRVASWATHQTRNNCAYVWMKLQREVQPQERMLGMAGTGRSLSCGIQMQFSDEMALYCLGLASSSYQVKIKRSSSFMFLSWTMLMVFKKYSVVHWINCWSLLKNDHTLLGLLPSPHAVFFSGERTWWNATEWQVFYFIEIFPYKRVYIF